MAGPTLVSALALDGLTLRVTWSGPIKAVDTEDSDDALNPSNYTLAASTVPAVPLTVVSVAQVYVGTTLVEEQVDLTLDWDQTPGASYMLAAANVVGIVGTTYTDPTPGTPQAPFTGYVPRSPAGRRFSLWEMVPSRNRRLDLSGDLRKLIACWQDPLTLLLAKIDEFADLVDYAKTPARYLDALLAGLGNPFPFVLSEINKRRLLAVLVAIYREKGTEVGIQDVLRFFLGVEATFRYTARDDTWEIPVCRLGGTDASGQTVTVPDHTNDRLVLGADCHFETDDPVEFTTAGTLPAPLVPGTTYYVRDVSGTSFKLTATAGGAVIDITDAGSGVHTVFNRDPGTCMCGPGYDSEWRYGFEVLLDLSLTAEQRTQALRIIDVMRPVEERLMALYEAGVKTWP